MVTGGPRLLQPDEAARLLYEGWPTPICMLDAMGRLVGMNPAAERFWGRRLREIGGRSAMEALGMRPATAAADTPALLRGAAGSGGVLVCTLLGIDGGVRSLSLRVTPLRASGIGYFLVGVIADDPFHRDGDAPAWAWTDPVTGLGNRACYERQRDRWDRTGGAVAFLDMDDLKGLNDLYGHTAGDLALSLAGEILRERLPTASLAVRYGGDEFLVLTAGATAAEGLARHVEAELARRGRSTLPLAPGMSWGVAAFGPGGLDAAVRAADDALYERKGVLFRAASGARLVLTRAGQRLLGHGVDRASALSPRGRGVAELLCGGGDGAVAEARAFIAFVAPPNGGAVVEVGAGQGRLTVDGGLAAAVGARGQLLVTDPVETRLRAAHRYGAMHGHAWVRYLLSAAEDLPLASGTADLVLGGLFLHRAHAGRALSEMARVVRPGGQVAFSAVLPFEWPEDWPGLRPLDAGSVEVRHRPGTEATESQLRALVAAAGLQVIRAEVRLQAMEPLTTAAEAADVLRRLGQAGVPGVGVRGPGAMVGRPTAMRYQAEAAVARDAALEVREYRLRTRLLYLVAGKPPITSTV